RRFTRTHANLLSRTVALPVIVGAALLKGVRLRRRGLEPGLRRAMAAGVAASFASTLASQKLIDLVERDRALWPYAAYRIGLAGAVFWKLGRGRRRSIWQGRGDMAAETGGDGYQPGTRHRPEPGQVVPRGEAAT